MIIMLSKNSKLIILISKYYANIANDIVIIRTYGVYNSNNIHNSGEDVKYILQGNRGNRTTRFISVDL